MSIALFINAQKNWQACNENALQLIHAFIQKKHTIEGVFFYGQSVQLMTNRAILNQWIELSNKHDFKLLACSTMLQQQQLLALAQDNHFPFAGMASWIQWSEQASHVVELN